MKCAVLTQEQVEKLLKLNTADATFVPCWSSLGGVTIRENEFDVAGFEEHKALIETFNLSWIELQDEDI